MTSKAIKLDAVLQIHELLAKLKLNPDETLQVLCELTACAILAYEIKFEIDLEEFVTEDIKRIIQEMKDMKGIK